MNRPTIDGLTSDQWFHATALLATVALALGLALLCAHSIRQAIAFLRERAEEQRRHQAWLDERQRLSESPWGYVRQQLKDRSVTHEPRPFPFQRWALPHYR